MNMHASSPRICALVGTSSRKLSSICGQSSSHKKNEVVSQSLRASELSLTIQPSHKLTADVNVGISHFL